LTVTRAESERNKSLFGGTESETFATASSDVKQKTARIEEMTEVDRRKTTEIEALQIAVTSKES
jgi:hypothetical protein